jgi:outer membrane autotransporter protein
LDRTIATSAGLLDYDASYDQDVASTTIGMDVVRPAMNGELIFGGSVGYVDSRAAFDQQSTSIDMDGFAAHAYATYLRNGWFVSGSMGAAQLNAQIEAPSLAGFTPLGTDVSSIGGTLEAGFRAPFLLGTTIEPTVALAYVRTSVDDVAAVGSTLRFEDSESLRPSIGARISGDAMMGGGWATRYNVSARAVGEGRGDNAVVVDSAGPNIAIVDRFRSLFGEVKAGLVSDSKNGWSVFGDITGRYGEDFQSVGASVGMRLRY